MIVLRLGSGGCSSSDFRDICIAKEYGLLLTAVLLDKLESVTMAGDDLVRRSTLYQGIAATCLTWWFAAQRAADRAYEMHRSCRWCDDWLE